MQNKVIEEVSNPKIDFVLDIEELKIQDASKSAAEVDKVFM